MCRPLLNTASRGRSPDPFTLRRTRVRTLRRASVRACDRFIVSLPAGLSDLAADDLAGVLDSLRLVRVGHPQPPDLGGRLPDLLPVRARDRELARFRIERHGDPVGNREVDRVRVAEREHDRFAFDLGLVADADDLELARKSLRHPFDRVRDQAAHEAMPGALLRLVVRAREPYFSLVNFDRDPGRDPAGELALRPLDADELAVGVDLDSLRDRHGHSSDA